jgi:subtilase family serine protease
MNRAFHPRRHMSVLIKSSMIMLCVLMLALRGSSTFAASERSQAHYYLLPGVASSLLKDNPPLGLTPPNNSLQILVSLSLRHRPELQTLLVEQENPASVLYHKYLTPHAFTSQFGPTPLTVSQVVTFLKSQGLQVTHVSSNNVLIHAIASVAQAEKAFHVVINNYRLKDRVVYSLATNPMLPTSLQGVIQNIAGLNDIADYVPLGLQQRKILPNTHPVGGYTPSEIRTAYNFNPLGHAGGDGTGQTVALFELDGYNPLDVNEYLSTYHLGSAKYSTVLVDGATNKPGPGTIEANLDMELMSALAPNATQKIYIGPNSNVGNNDVLNTIVTDDIAQVASISWGECEAASGTSELNALDDIFEQGAAQGQSFFASSGDLGAYDCGDTDLAVDSPGDDPHVISVGGTALQTGSDGLYSSEAVWRSSSNQESGFNGSGSGGGISAYFARPTYQHGPQLTNAHRMMPDVSANADPSTGYSAFCSGTSPLCTGWLVIGGTSAAAPLWAALAVDTNSYLSVQHKRSLGNINTALYTLYNTKQPYEAYHDITSGTNLYYAAGIGYDLATGLGTPNAWNFARDLEAF